MDHSDEEEAQATQDVGSRDDVNLPQPAATPEPEPAATPEPEPAGRPPRRGTIVLAAVLAGLLLISAGIGIGWGLGRGGSSSAPTTVQAPIRLVPQTGPSAGRAGNGLNLQAIANRVDPAVVDINTVVGGIVSPRGQGAGTGMVLTSSGEVLTNNHVIEGATNIKVAIPGRSGGYTASVIGVAPTADVALLQIEGVSGLPAVSLASSSSLSVGQAVVAIGNAFGQGGSPTVTDGTISALDQSITVGDDLGSAEHLKGLIQTDASISPGDSGGPLVNSVGQVVGMITASRRGNPVPGASNVGFAIPVDTAIGLVNEMRAGHSSSSIILGQPGFIGVQIRNLDAATAARLGLNVTSGALVVGVVPGSPAESAGIARDAVITAVDGQKIGSAAALGPAVHTHKPGEQIRVTWVDQTGTHTATLRLITGPAI